MEYDLVTARIIREALGKSRAYYFRKCLGHSGPKRCREILPENVVFVSEDMLRHYLVFLCLSWCVSEEKNLIKREFFRNDVDTETAVRRAVEEIRKVKGFNWSPPAWFYEREIG